MAVGRIVFSTRLVSIGSTSGEELANHRSADAVEFAPECRTAKVGQASSLSRTLPDETNAPSDLDVISKPRSSRGNEALVNSEFRIPHSEFEVSLFTSSATVLKEASLKCRFVRLKKILAPSAFETGRMPVLLDGSAAYSCKIGLTDCRTPIVDCQTGVVRCREPFCACKRRDRRCMGQFVSCMTHPLNRKQHDGSRRGWFVPCKTRASNRKGQALSCEIRVAGCEMEDRACEVHRLSCKRQNLICRGKGFLRKGHGLFCTGRCIPFKRPSFTRNFQSERSWRQTSPGRSGTMCRRDGRDACPAASALRSG